MEATKTSQTKRILTKLRVNRTVTNTELNKIAYRYSARILELRNDGHNIQKKYVRRGVVLYWLVPEREFADEY